MSRSSQLERMRAGDSLIAGSFRVTPDHIKQYIGSALGPASVEWVDVSAFHGTGSGAHSEIGGASHALPGAQAPGRASTDLRPLMLPLHGRTIISGVNGNCVCPVPVLVGRAVALLRPFTGGLRSDATVVRGIREIIVHGQAVVGESLTCMATVGRTVAPRSEGDGPCIAVDVVLRRRSQAPCLSFGVELRLGTRHDVGTASAPDPIKPARTNRQSAVRRGPQKITHGDMDGRPGSSVRDTVAPPT